MAASISQLLSKPPNSTTFPLSSSNSSFSSPRPFTTTTPILNKTPHLIATISCNANNKKNNYSPPSSSELNRRDVLIGLGGLSSAALTSLSSQNSAQADPYPLPDLTTCKQIDIYPNAMPPTRCCPPYKTGDKYTEFTLPDSKLPLRLRPAAQHVDDQYLDKFKTALRLMKDLPDNDPRSFRNQANVHCAYCEGGYSYNEKKTQVHYSWLFLPWHRMYLYFFEKILGNMINDDTFAIPFWNWDAPDGMRIPQIYKDRTSPLYDALRYEDHLCALIDLNFSSQTEEQKKVFDNEKVLDDQRIRENLVIMHRQVFHNGSKPQAFLGFPYRFGKEISDTSGMGQLENVPHNKIHRWTGDNKQLYHEDMGMFYSAGRDPIFYAHHANCDRVWDLWKTLVWKSDKPEFTDKDWLDATFLLYDEHGKLNSAKVSDALSSSKLRYNYVDVPNLWIKTPPVSKTTKDSRKVKPVVELTDLSNFPITLKTAVATKVPRPEEVIGKTSEKMEFLVVDGIEIEANQYATFDVYVNTPEGHETIRHDAREFAGSFAVLPHHQKVTTRVLFGLSEIIKDHEAEGDDSILVTLVPRSSVGSVTIGGMHIDLLD